MHQCEIISKFHENFTGNIKKSLHNYYTIFVQIILIRNPNYCALEATSNKADYFDAAIIDATVLMMLLLLMLLLLMLLLLMLLLFMLLILLLFSVDADTIDAITSLGRKKMLNLFFCYQIFYFSLT